MAWVNASVYGGVQGLMIFRNKECEWQSYLLDEMKQHVGERGEAFRNRSETG